MNSVEIFVHSSANADIFLNSKVFREAGTTREANCYRLPYRDSQYVTPFCSHGPARRRVAALYVERPPPSPQAAHHGHGERIVTETLFIVTMLPATAVIILRSPFCFLKTGPNAEQQTQAAELGATRCLWSRNTAPNVTMNFFKREKAIALQRIAYISPMVLITWC